MQSYGAHLVARPLPVALALQRYKRRYESECWRIADAWSGYHVHSLIQSLQ